MNDRFWPAPIFRPAKSGGDRPTAPRRNLTVRISVHSIEIVELTLCENCVIRLIMVVMGDAFARPTPRLRFKSSHPARLFPPIFIIQATANQAYDVRCAVVRRDSRCTKIWQILAQAANDSPCCIRFDSSMADRPGHLPAGFPRPTTVQKASRTQAAATASALPRGRASVRCQGPGTDTAW